MRGFLNEHKDKQDSFNDWLRKAEGQIQSATKLVSDLENLQQYAEELEVRVVHPAKILYQVTNYVQKPAHWWLPVEEGK